MRNSTACASFSALLLMLCAACATSPVTVAAPAVTAPLATRVLGQATVYISGAGDRLEVVHDGGTGVAIIRLPNGGMALLPAEIAGSEGRYRDGRMTLWENGGNALLWSDGTLLFSGREEAGR